MLNKSSRSVKYAVLKYQLGKVLYFCCV